jgi:hypothetical protein
MHAFYTGTGVPKKSSTERFWSTPIPIIPEDHDAMETRRVPSNADFVAPPKLCVNNIRHHQISCSAEILGTFCRKIEEHYLPKFYEEAGS